MNDRDLAQEQALLYARELGELYRRNRETADGMKAAREAEGRIRAVLDGDGHSTVFQPIANLHTGQLVGVEALSRFAPEPERGPELWFAEAKAVGLLVELETFAARRALDYLPRVPAGEYLSVNLSPATVASPAFHELFEALPCERLVIEVTEHAAVEDYTELEGAFSWFRRRGGRVAVDDAGAGFASPRHILALAPDIIKLDTCLTRDVDTDRGRRAMARALISFAEEVGAAVTAEGVETAGEMLALRFLKVRSGQGFHLGRPARFEDLSWQPLAV